MSNKYDSSEHIKVLAELLTLQTVVNETQDKINVANAKLDEIKVLLKKKEDNDDEIPF